MTKLNIILKFVKGSEISDNIICNEQPPSIKIGHGYEESLKQVKGDFYPKISKFEVPKGYVNIVKRISVHPNKFS